MSKSLDKLTKAELIAVIGVKDTELAALRAQLSVHRAPQATSRPVWLLEADAKREAAAQAKADAMRFGVTTLVRR